VAVDSKSTVLTPSAPVEVKLEIPFTAAGSDVVGGAGEGDDEVTVPPELEVDEEVVVDEDEVVKGAVVEGTIPPKLNVLVEDVVLNWRSFRLMTDGEAAGVLRLMTGGPSDGCGPAA
jgi:hypothetical protein